MSCQAARRRLELALRHPRDRRGYEAAIGEALGDTNRLIALAEDLLTLARLGFRAEGRPTSTARLSALADALTRWRRLEA